MPTGYTAQLMGKGQDFRSFILTCARAMGACVMQRDDPMSDPPKELEPSDYGAKRLAEAIAEQGRLLAMSNDEQFDFGSKRKSEAITRAAEYLQRQQDENLRLDDMMKAVLAWQPPTSEHAGLKSFMIEQITISRNTGAWAEKSLREATTKSHRQFYDEALTTAGRDIEYHRKAHTEEVQRTDSRNQWIRQLYGSLTKMEEHGIK